MHQQKGKNFTQVTFNTNCESLSTFEKNRHFSSKKCYWGCEVKYKKMCSSKPCWAQGCMIGAQNLLYIYMYYTSTWQGCLERVISCNLQSSPHVPLTCSNWGAIGWAAGITWSSFIDWCNWVCSGNHFHIYGWFPEHTARLKG